MSEQAVHDDYLYTLYSNEVEQLRSEVRRLEDQMQKILEVLSRQAANNATGNQHS